MAERILIGVAWPYANGPLHMGHIAGCYLPADIFARYHRTKGNEVLMVSGSDQHGTPVTVRAEQEGKSPAEVAESYHQGFLTAWGQLGISFDLFTRTGTENHAAVTHDIFLALLRKGYIYPDTMSMPYCTTDRRFLPDRYVEGTCPHCGSSGARGDQCDNCGRTLDPQNLVDWRCRFCGNPPEIRETRHFFLRLSAFNDALTEWVQKQQHWRLNVRNFSLGFLHEGLRDRAITRDIDWGVSVPLEGYADKRIYVWFEAVIGYLSASIEWAQRKGQPDKWKKFWQDPATKSYYFIGKDNIVFHTVIWPAMLLGYEGLNLPYDVPANEFLTLEGRQLSTSRNWAVWLPDYLARYDPDPLRYLLSANMPETSDSDFSWREYVRRNNDELVATYGNLVHRVLTFTYRNFQEAVPAPGPYNQQDQALLTKAPETLAAVDSFLYQCRFRDALRAAFALAQESNRYLDDQAPWRTLREDRERTATTLYVALTIISCLKKVLYPFLPFSSQHLHQLMGYSGKVEEEGWSFQPPPMGQRLQPPEPLFRKLDEAVSEEEAGKLGRSS